MFLDGWQIGPITLYPQTAAMMVGPVLAVLLALYRARRRHTTSKVVLALGLLAILAGFIGAKAYNAVFYWQQVVDDPIGFLIHNSSGFGVLGSFLLTVPIWAWYLRSRDDRPWETLDLASIPVMVAVAVGRIGCFAGGCCFGKPGVGLLWAVFSPHSPAGSAFPNQALVPTQLYHAFDAQVAILILLWFERRQRYAGHTFCLMLFLYGLDRFVMDFYRYYTDVQLLPPLGGYSIPISQVLALIMIIFAVLLARYLKHGRLVGRSIATAG